MTTDGFKVASFQLEGTSYLLHVFPGFTLILSQPAKLAEDNLPRFVDVYCKFLIMSIERITGCTGKNTKC